MPDNTAAAPPHPWRAITVKHVTRVLNDLEREGGWEYRRHWGETRLRSPGI